MPAVVRSVPQFTATRDQAWHLSGWASHRVVAGGTSRHLDLAQFLETLDPSTIPVEAEQVHGSSVAIIGAIRPVAHRARHSAATSMVAAPPVAGQPRPCQPSTTIFTPMTASMTITRRRKITADTRRTSRCPIHAPMKATTIRLMSTGMKCWGINPPAR